MGKTEGYPLKRGNDFSLSVPALVLGVDVSALNIIRSLGRHGVRVYAMGSRPDDYGAVSRYAKFVFCENLNEEQCVVSKLLHMGHHLSKKMVLFCTSDLHVLFVSRNRKRLEPYFYFILPDHEVVERLMSKEKFFEFASKQGFCIPRTVVSKNRQTLETIATKISYPCVVKPLYRTKYWSDHVPPDKKVFKAYSPHDLKKKIDDLAASDQPLILQEWIPGDDDQVYFCLVYLDRKSVPLAILTGRKLRQYPPLTGVTSLAESIDHQDIGVETLKMLTAAGCKGLCSVEFKFRSEDRSYRITEPTVGRIDLQEGISTKSGIDIPFIAYQDAIGVPQPAWKDGITPVKWINEPFEFNAFLTQVKRSRRNVYHFFRPYQGNRSYALFSTDDPVPFLFFLKWVAKRSFQYFIHVASRKITA